MTNTLEELRKLLEQAKGGDSWATAAAQEKLALAAVNALPGLIACAESLEWALKHVGKRGTATFEANRERAEAALAALTK